MLKRWWEKGEEVGKVECEEEEKRSSEAIEIW